MISTEKKKKFHLLLHAHAPTYKILSTNEAS